MIIIILHRYFIVNLDDMIDEFISSFELLAAGTSPIISFFSLCFCDDKWI